MQNAEDGVNAGPVNHALEQDDIFINFVHPDKTRTQQVRRAIRSRAARSSADARKATIAAKQLKSVKKSESQTSTARHVSKGSSSSEGLTAVVRCDSLFTNVDEVASASVPPSPRIVTRLGQGRVDPFQSFATLGAWHESFPRLIDIYLEFIANPSKSPNAGFSEPARAVLRTDIWPEMRSSSALFYANLLVAAFHDSLKRGFRPESTFVAWIRDMAIRSINEGVSKGLPPSNATVAAVSILAAFEMEFGDMSAFDAHMKGLQMMVRVRGGLDGNDLPEVVKLLVLCAGFDLPMFSCVQPYFRPNKLIGMEEITDRRPGTLPPAFQRLKEMSLLQSPLLVLVSDTWNLSPASPDSRLRLRSIAERLVACGTTTFIACEFCPIQSAVEDDMNNYAHLLLREALLTITNAHWSVLSDDTMEEMLVDEFRRIKHETPILHPELLVGTVYAELTLWALFIICGRSPQRDAHLENVLKRIAGDLNLNLWPKVAAILNNYFPLKYGDLQSSCESVWIQLRSLGPDVTLPDSGKVSRYNTDYFGVRL